MDRNTRVTKGYSTYTNIPPRQDGYDHGLNQYVVETTTTKQVGTPTTGYSKFGSLPSKIEIRKEYVQSPSSGYVQSPSSGSKYTPKDRHERYGPNYGPYYDNLNPLHYYGRENLRDPLVNESQTKMNQPMKFGYFSSPNEYYSSSPSLERAQHVRNGNNSGQNNSWMSAGPPMTHHALTTSTDDINEALSFLENPPHYSPRLGPRRRQPSEFERQYQEPAFDHATIQPRYYTHE